MPTETAYTDKFQRLSPHTQQILFHLCSAQAEQAETTFKEWNKQVAEQAGAPAATVKSIYYRYMRKWSDAEKQAYLAWYTPEQAQTEAPQAEAETAATEQVSATEVEEAVLRDTAAEDKTLPEETTEPAQISKQETAEEAQQAVQTEPEAQPQQVSDQAVQPEAAPQPKPQPKHAAKHRQAREIPDQVDNSVTFRCGNRKLLVFQQQEWYCLESQLLSFLQLSSKNPTFRSMLLPQVEIIQHKILGKSRSYRLEQAAAFVSAFMNITTNETQRTASSVFLEQYSKMAAQNQTVMPVQPTAPAEATPVAAAVEQPAEVQPAVLPALSMEAPAHDKELERIIRLLNETIGFLSPAAKEELLRLTQEQGYVSTTLGILQTWDHIQRDLSLHFLHLVEEHIRGYL
ncbi:hypothetical protein [Ectobacillus ponti]|uniref:Uncharacterized protein n=1 Tax=Ectobacillus ponti TaxID=2961894 RepID=A0AA41X8Y4_9BACI|nr:hypothetical protein [Ectobacillus ponti]MCP8969318.1 hypothetical protein [Ectobacillus ponti]